MPQFMNQAYKQGSGCYSRLVDQQKNSNQCHEQKLDLYGYSKKPKPQHANHPLKQQAITVWKAQGYIDIPD